MEPARRPRILVVEDDHTLQTMITGYLREIGYEVMEADNGEVALGRLGEFRPDLILTDVVMPVMDGFTLLKQLKKSADWQSIPVMVMTQLDDDDSIDLAFKMGAIELVLKPPIWEVLRRRIELALQWSMSPPQALPGGEIVRIVVEEDDPALQQQIVSALASQGYQVSVAQDGGTALGAIQQFRPHLIILDALQTDPDGFQTCSEVRNLPGMMETPVLMLTGLHDDESARRSFDAGATDFMVKPFNWAELRHRIHVLLHSAGILEPSAVAATMPTTRRTQVPVRTGEDGFTGPKTFALKPRNGYLLETNDADMARPLLFRLTGQHRGCAVSRVDPESLKEEGFTGTGLWLSTARGDNLDPNDLEGISRRLRAFMREEKDSLVVLDGVEYIISYNEFGTVLRFLQSVKDTAVENSAIVVLIITPTAFEAQQLSQLQREYKSISLQLPE